MGGPSILFSRNTVFNRLYLCSHDRYSYQFRSDETHDRAGGVLIAATLKAIGERGRPMRGPQLRGLLGARARHHERRGQPRAVPAPPRHQRWRYTHHHRQPQPHHYDGSQLCPITHNMSPVGSAASHCS